MFGMTEVEISNCTSTMIVVILVGIIPITSWMNEEEMRVDKEFHKTGKGTIHVICYVWISRVKSEDYYLWI